MTTERRYALGVSLVALTAALLTLLVPAAARPSAWAALGAATVVQGPLGWWLVSAARTERFLLVWALGIGARLALVTVAGLVLVPRLALDLAPTLVTLVAVLMGFVMVEGIAVSPGTEDTRTA